MRNKYFRIIKVLIFINFICVPAQVKTKLETSKISIGDTTSLSITISARANSRIQLPPQRDSLNNYLLITKTKIDTITGEKGLKLNYRLTLTGFDTGDFIVNSLPISIDGDTIFSETKKLQIIGVSVDTLSQKIFPIKSNFADKITWWERNKENLLYTIIGLIILIPIILLAVYYLKKIFWKKGNEYTLTAYEEAMLSIKKLDDRKYLEKGDFYKFYIELSSIIRKYFARRYEFEAETLLKDDLPVYMQEKGYFTEGDRDELKQFLIDADQVKFAKSEIALKQSLVYREWIEKIINQTRPIEKEEPRFKK